MRPYILFIVMLLGAAALTAIIADTMDARVADQELRREQRHQQNN